MIALLTATVAAHAAGDDEAPWWVGLPLSDVQLAAAGGALPPESLEGLLRMQAAADRGEAIDPTLVRLDLATLFQVGEFSAVEAQVEPWVTTSEDGELRKAVLLTFVVWPAPRIAGKVRVEGARRVDRGWIADALGLSAGQVFYADTDEKAAETRVVSALVAKGYPDASADVTATTVADGTVEVVAVVHEGEPRIVDRVVITGDLEGVVSEGKLRRWARPAPGEPRTGVARGKPLPPDPGGMAAARQDIEAKLGDVSHPGLRPRHHPRRGWIEARVAPIATPAEDDPSRAQVTITVEPGAQLVIVPDGLRNNTNTAIGVRGRTLIVDALELDHRTRLTRGFVDRAPERIQEALQDRGRLQANVTVTLDESNELVKRLIVHADRGRRYTMRHRGFLVFDKKKVRFTFEGDEPLTRHEQRKLSKELELALDQASPDFLRRRIYTPVEMDDALNAARLVLVDRGHLDARLELLEPTFVEHGDHGTVKVVPNVAVSRGPVTRLSGLDVVAAADGVDIPGLDAAKLDLIGGPFSPQRIDALSVRIVEAHKAAGYLEADARVVQAEEAPGARTARIEVISGPQVLLRSTVVRHARRTRTSFVQNVVDDTLTIGQPITAPKLEEVRRDLYDLGTFRLVSLQLVGEEYESARDLVIDLTERGRWEFELSPGLSTDQGIRLFGRATRHNLWGLAHRIDILGQIGFDWASSDISDWLPDFSNPEWRLAVTYTAPRFPIPSQEATADIVLRQLDVERTWQMDRTGAGFGVETKLGHTRFRLGTRLELRRMQEIDEAVLLEGDPWTVLVGPTDPPAVPTPWRVQDSVTGTVVHDLRDDPISPHMGWLLSAKAEWAPGLPWEDWRDQPRTSFLKGETRFSGYVPIQRVTLHLGIGGGYVKSFRSGQEGGLVPIEDRFRLGGTGSFRGFVRDGVGPHNSAERVNVDWPAALGPAIEYTLRDDPRRWAPTGGDTTASGTAQLVVPLTAFGMVGWDNYSTSLFVDAGNVWFVDPTATPTTDQPRIADLIPFLRLGLGAGLQARTPIGPLSVDFAVNPQAAAATGAQRVQLVDELEEPWYRIHLTLGASL